MSQVTSFLARSFTFNANTIRAITEVLSEDDWKQSPSVDGGNTAHWILGHIASSRRTTARKLGGDIDEAKWESLFGMGAKPDSTDAYPATSTLTADIDARGTDLARLLGEMTDEQANSKWGPFPDGGKTLLDGTQFMFFHESYHVGQLGLIRRICGKPGFV